MIRFGPAGIPLSCKGRTLRDGIEDVHGLGLNAMEVQMVRVNVIDRFPDEEEVGLTPLEVESDLIMEIVRVKNKKEVRITRPTEKIKEDDTLITLASGLAQNFMELEELGRMGKEMDVQLSMHTPYYMDLASNSELTARCMDNIRWAGTDDRPDGRATWWSPTSAWRWTRTRRRPRRTSPRTSPRSWSGGRRTRSGPASGSRPAAGRRCSAPWKRSWRCATRSRAPCRSSTSPTPTPGRTAACGSRRTSAPCWTRYRNYVDGHFYTHFSGVEHEGGNEKRITPIKKGDLKFEPLADFLAEENPNITIISSSPLLEHDAMYMKVIYERVLTKRVAKDTKVQKVEKGEEEDEEEDRLRGG